MDRLQLSTATHREMYLWMRHGTLMVPILQSKVSTSPDGRVFGKMAHSERRGRSVAMNIYGEQDHEDL